MKKIIVPVLIVLLALIVLIGVLVYLFSAMASLSPRTQADSGEALTPEAYLASAWPDYGFYAYDASAGVLELTYQVNAAYDQVRKHGAEAGYDELAAGHAETAALIVYGCEKNCGISVREVVVTGLSSDGQEIYRSSTLNGVSGCWDAPDE